MTISSFTIAKRFPLAEATFIPAGVFYRQNECTQVNKGDTVFLVPEPENPYDHNAIKVVAKNDSGDDLHIGYVKKTVAPTILNDVVENRYACTVHEVKTDSQGIVQPYIRVLYTQDIPIDWICRVNELRAKTE